MKTRWSAQVDPSCPLPEYPRPQMVRPDWINLNGPWEYAIQPKENEMPKAWDGIITVPFPVESTLSGVTQRVGAQQRLWYRRTFTTPRLKEGGRLLLHFGAVDWESTVWVNGTQVGVHRGGYDPFTFDITDALRPQNPQEIIVAVWDPTDTGDQARGKQSDEPRGIWYEPVTGLWQTVWLEPVPAAFIDRLFLVPDVNASELRVDVVGRGCHDDARVRLVARTGTTQISEAEGALGQTIHLPVPEPILWSPEHPFLYDLDVELYQRGVLVDRVTSYFGMRKVAVGQDAHGRPVITLNDAVTFQIGPLDQGWWPDGLYTAPTDDALRFDIEATKDFGFNMIRKHVKVEPARWYYHCDRLGMLVWQDMPNANPDRRHGDALWVKQNDPTDGVRTADSARQFEQELGAVVDALFNHPSIVMWIPFNEGWGQYDTERITAWLKARDPHRLVNAASGWTDRGVGDVLDIHEYPGPSIETCPQGRVPVLGEFGGLGLALEGHVWTDDGNWGYRSYGDPKTLAREYQKLIKALEGPIAKGLAAAVYTQTTDVEREVNGLLTYDREVYKLDPDTLRMLHATLFRPAPAATILVPTAGTTEGTTNGMPATTDTSLNTAEVRLHRTFTIPADTSFTRLWLELRFAADELRIFLNEQPIYTVDERREVRRHYRHFDVSEHVDTLRSGTNTLTVHALGNDRSPFVDVGLYAV